jgi:fructosamine-3-kinase
VIDAIAAACGSGVARSRPVAGGSINEALHVVLDDGRELFVKHRADPPDGFYAAEAAGLRWIAGPLPVPSPVAVDERFLVLGWIASAARADGFDTALGAGLARLHALGADRHGATGDGGPTFVGPLRLPNEPAGDGSWAAFYSERRLAPLLELAHGALPAGATGRIESVIARLAELCGPEEPVARLHGDLWSGNVMAGPDGAPVLVDPAAYGGHREVDLAMLSLFGAPGRRVLPAYEDAGTPLADGHEERVELFQLLPLLVHAALFGGGYGAAADRAARRYR